ncbi:hypothetical protein WA158_002140 [Blastocystis sp. Blastoise]
MLQCQNSDYYNTYSNRVFAFQRKYKKEIPLSAYSKGLYVLFQTPESSTKTSVDVQDLEEQRSSDVSYSNQDLSYMNSDSYILNDDELQRDLMKPDNFTPQTVPIPVITVSTKDSISSLTNNNTDDIIKIIGYTKCYRITGYICGLLTFFVILLCFDKLVMSNICIVIIPALISLCLLLGAYHYNDINPFYIFETASTLVFSILVLYQTVRFYFLLKKIPIDERPELPAREFYSQIKCSC